MKHLARIKKESAQQPLRDILTWPLDRLENVVKAAKAVKTLYSLGNDSTILDIVMAATVEDNDVSALARIVNAWGDGKSGFESCKTTEASAPQKMDIVVRGGNHDMKPGDIYLRIPYLKLVEMGYIKDGDIVDNRTAEKVRRGLDIKMHKETGVNSYYPDEAFDVFTISFGNLVEGTHVWGGDTKGDAFDNWLRNTHLTIRPEEPFEEKYPEASSMADFKKAVSEYPESVDIQHVIDVFLGLKPDDMEEVVNVPDGTYPKAIEDAIYDEFEKIIGMGA